jgi:hypothetical protein
VFCTFSWLASVDKITEHFRSAFNTFSLRVLAADTAQATNHAQIEHASVDSSSTCSS